MESMFQALLKLIRFYLISYSYLKRLRAHGRENVIKDTNFLCEAKNTWSNKIFALMNITPQISGREHLSPGKAHLFLGNHVSYLDIPLLFSAAPEVTFVAKEELASWPVIGGCIRSADILLVKRESADSRKQAALAISDWIIQKKRPVAIFPSGTTTVDEKKPWKYGAFKIAKEHGVPVQPFRLRYKPLRKAAYIDDDSFLPHFWRLLGEGSIVAELEFGQPFMVQDIEADIARLQAWSQAYLAELEK